MKRTIVAAFLSFAFLSVVTRTSVLAHEDDPKLRDRVPRYEGPGWIPGSDDAFPHGPGFSADGIELLSWISLPDFDLATGSANANGNSCWGYVSPANREYAIMGLEDGTAFVEITTPTAPVVAAFIPGPQSLWRDMKTYQNFCYAISEGGSGIQVMNMYNIDGTTNRVTLQGIVTADGSIPTLATHTLFVDEVSGFLYRCGGGNNGLRIYSLANPAVPAFVGQWTDRYVHECQVLTYTSGPYAGKQIAFVCSGGFNQTGLDILDVTNKASIINLTPNRIFWSNPGYSHQLWLTPDRQFAYLNDELDEDNFNLPTRTIIINTQSLELASVVGEFTNNNPAIGHNLYVKDNLIFESNYTSGLRIFCNDNPMAPVEIGYFDTRPESEGATFNGLWNNWPFFPSGVVIGSDIERGLFVWDLNVQSQPLNISYPQGRPTLVNPLGGTTMAVAVTGCAEAAIQPGSATLHVDTGGGYSTLPLADLGNGQYQATFPAAPCGQTVSYYVSVQNMLGQTYTDPIGAPTGAYTAISATGTDVSLEDSFELASTWTVGDPQNPDNAISGLWSLGDPEPTSAQPGDDHTPAPGTKCWVTDWHAGAGAGSFDVDGGKTTLRSPTLSSAGMTNPFLRYWRWYSNSAGSIPNADIFVVDISYDNGSTWSNLETVGPAGAGTSGGWIEATHSITPSSQIRLRFVASDFGQGSLVEAAIDDVQIFEYDCNVTTCTKADVNDDGAVNGLDIDLFAETVIANGPSGTVAFCASDVDSDGTIADGDDLAGFVNCVLSSGCP
jgi:choice-of-anchor B domain-containing protein